MTRFGILIAVVILVVARPSAAHAQARPLITTSTQPVRLSNTVGEQVVLGSVSLGKQRYFTMFNIQAAGTISPNPNLNGAAFQLQFLICDQPDCSGDIKTNIRILADADSASPARVIATRSFGVSTHSTRPVALTDYKTRTPNDDLYLAVALKPLHGSGTTPFAAKLTLLRVDVMP